MDAVILAAGRGARIWPYGETCPKATLPIVNRPLVAHLVDVARSVGARRVVVVCGHLSGQVRAALVDSDVLFANQPEPTGTADALWAGAALIEPEDELLVLHGDVLVAQSDVARLLDALRAQSDAIAAALVAPLGDEDPRDWLCGEVGSGRLTGVLGHPRSGSHRLAGVYALRPAAMRYVRGNPGSGVRVEVGGMPPLEAELAESLGLMIDRGLPVVATVADEAVVDLDKPWHLLEANAVAAQWLFAGLTESRIDPSANIHPEADVEGLLVLEPGAYLGPRVRVRGRAWLAAGSRVDNGAILAGTVVVGPDSVVADYCHVSDCVIGRGCRVLHGAEASGVIMDGAYLYHYMEFCGVLGRSADLGAATVCGTLRFDDGDTAHCVGGRWETPRFGANAAYLGDYTRTGVNAILMPGCKVGPYSIVGPGVVLTGDLPSRTCRLLRQEVIDRPWGPERYGW